MYTLILVLSLEMKERRILVISEIIKIWHFGSQYDLGQGFSFSLGNFYDSLYSTFNRSCHNFSGERATGQFSGWGR